MERLKKIKNEKYRDSFKVKCYFITEDLSVSGMLKNHKLAMAIGDVSWYGFARQLEYKAAKEDPYRLKKKSVRGGSWKDPESYIRSAWRSWEYQNQPRSYIGFRCVRSIATSSSIKQKGKK